MSTSFSVKQQAVIDDITQTDAADVKQMAVKQLQMLSDYYSLSLSHASRSFWVALIISAIGFVFLLLAVWRLMSGEPVSDGSITASLIGGAVAEFVAGVNFFLYGKTLEQLNRFQGKLENSQRFLLANSLCESIDQLPLKNQTRLHLIGALIGVQQDLAPPELNPSVAAPETPDAFPEVLPRELPQANPAVAASTVHP